MKHQTVPKLTLSQAIKLLKNLKITRERQQRKRCHISMMAAVEKVNQAALMHGTISTQTKVWVTVILNGLKHLEELVNEQSGGISGGGGGGGGGGQSLLNFRQTFKFPTIPKAVFSPLLDQNLLIFVNFS